MKMHNWSFSQLKRRGYGEWLEEFLKFADGPDTSQSQVNEGWLITVGNAILKEKSHALLSTVAKYEDTELLNIFNLLWASKFEVLPKEVLEVMQMKEAFEKQEQQEFRDAFRSYEKQMQQLSDEIEQKELDKQLKEMEKQQQQQQQQEESGGSDCQETLNKSTGFQQSEMIPMTTSTATQPSNAGVSAQSTRTQRKKYGKLSTEDKKLMRVAKQITASYDERLHVGHKKFSTTMQEKHPKLSAKQLEVAWRVEQDRRKNLKKSRKFGTGYAVRDWVVEEEGAEEGQVEEGEAQRWSVVEYGGEVDPSTHEASQPLPFWRRALQFLWR